MSPSHAQPTLALVMCVHDEAPFLRAHLAWHEAVGVQRAYVFLDRCTDDSKAIVEEFPWAQGIERDRPAGTRFMREFQNACATEALERSRAEGFEWLLHVDADELASGAREAGRIPPTEPTWWRRLSGAARRSRSRRAEEARTRCSLPAMLAGVRPETELVVLPTREALPMRPARDDAFWRTPFFQRDTPFIRKIHDPVSDHRIKLDRFLGHDQGKSIVRTAADVQPFNPHKWTRNQGIRPPDFPELVPLATEERGCHYHFLFGTPAHWLKKYRQFDGLALSWPSGEPLRFPKGSWRQVAGEWSIEEAADYLERWVYFPPDEAARLAGDPKVGNVIAEYDVVDVLAERLVGAPARG